MNYTPIIAKELDIKENQVEVALRLFGEGGTVPFIARYRKDMTGSLDEMQLRDIQHQSEYFKELDDRKATIVKSIQEQGKMTPDLEKKITECLNKLELEDLYLPYKPKRRTKATIAKEKGLEPLAEIIKKQDTPEANVDDIARIYLSEEHGLTDPKAAIAGALDIIAEEISENADYKRYIREESEEHGFLVSEARKEFADKPSKFSTYYNFKEAVSKIPSHRILAIRRGEKEKVLKLSFELNEENHVSYIKSQYITAESPWKEYLEKCIEDSYSRLIKNSVETEIRVLIKKRAEDEALSVFSKNLKDVLLAPPAGQKSVLALDPGFKSGIKVAVLDQNGKYLHNDVIYPHPPQRQTVEASQRVKQLIVKFNIDMIAIGNGTASRETDAFVSKVIQGIDNKPIKIIVNESGASVYSASIEAIKEFPNEDVTTRGAISIGRRLQDPLAELVKVEPKSIGVGQYQHDVNQTKLRKRLDEVVESCVNTVGVNLNTASESLLGYVAGVSKPLAQNIIKYRDDNGSFNSRDELLKVPQFGPKAFEQSAGFLRIPDAENPLDCSAVHPEHYKLVEEICSDISTELKAIIGNNDVLKSVEVEKYKTEEIGIHTLEDILEELEKPNRDPRKQFTYAKFNDKFQSIQDLVTGSWVEGVVTNVTNFGAFVDIGVHQDGLLHVSEMSDQFINDAKTLLAVGDIVKAKVISVDVEQKRIALSMKSDSPVTGSNKGKKGKSHQKSHSTLADLKQKFKGKENSKQNKAVKPSLSLKSIMRSGR